MRQPKPSFKYVNRRGLLSTFFKYAYQQDWIGANPIEKVRHYRRGFCPKQG